MLHPSTSLTTETQVGAGSLEQPLSIPFDTSGHRDGRSGHLMTRRLMPVHEIIVSGILHIALLVVVLSSGFVPSLVVRPTSAVTVYLTEGSQQRKSPVLSEAPGKHTAVVTKPVRDGEERKESHPVLATPVSEIPAASENVEPEVMRSQRSSAPVQEAVSGGAGRLTGSTEVPRDDQGNREENKEGGPYQVEFGAPDGPRFLKRVEPVYPPLARRLGKEGRVLLSLLIDHAGRLVSVEIIEKADFGFDRAAVDAVKASTFSPAVKNGKGMTSRSKLAVKFVLTGE